jgi:arylsulfatase A-like enzyme
MQRIGRRRAIKLLGAGALGLATPSMAWRAHGATPRKSPNVLFIMTDDQAQGALSVYGNTILATPNMDRIGREGLRFNEAFVTNSLCAPSRASFLTGLYSHTHGVTTNGEESGWYEQAGIPDSIPTWPKLLRDGGYETAIVGKWHIKSLPAGFDHWAILPGHGTYFDPDFIVNTDDVIADQALAWLKHRTTDKPYCLLCQFKAPHSPWEPAPRFANEFTDVEIPLPPAFAELPAGMPQAVRKTQMSITDMDFGQRGVPRDLPDEQRTRANLQALVKNYYRVLRGVDQNVGRILEFLDAARLAHDTIVIYTSDNGFFLGEFGLFDKRLMYEPAIRVPMLVRWPAAIEAGRVDNEHMVLNIDVAATLLDVCGVAVPESLHGRSWRQLFGAQRTQWRAAFLYEFFEYPAVHCVRKHRGVRSRRWKLIHFYEQPDEYALYDLERDPHELVNLAVRREHASRRKQLFERLQALRRETGDIDPAGYVAPRLQPGKCPA